MPCFGNTWDSGLDPGSPEYCDAKKRVQEKLDRLLHVINYYERIYAAKMPDPLYIYNFALMGEERIRLLESVYHHLKCDGVNASTLLNIQCLIRKEDHPNQRNLDIVKWCMWLARGKGYSIFDPRSSFRGLNKQEYLIFWEKLAQQLRLRDSYFEYSRANPFPWLIIPQHSQGINYSIEVESLSTVSVGLHCSRPSAKTVFAGLLKEKEKVENSLGLAITWNENTDISRWQVSSFLTDISLNDYQSWDKYIKMIVAQLRQMVDAFSPLLSKLSVDSPIDYFSSYRLAFARIDPGILFCQKKEYMHIHLPGQPKGINKCNSHHLIVEKNGTIGFSVAIAKLVNAHERPKVAISEHPLGFSSGPTFGRFTYALSYEEVIKKYNNIELFALHLVRQVKKTDLWQVSLKESCS